MSNISIASLHASADPALASAHGNSRRGSLTYKHTSVEDLLAERGPASFDVVCSMEVLEHVDNPRSFLASCAQLVKVRSYTYTHTSTSDTLTFSLAATFSYPLSPAHPSPTSSRSSQQKTSYSGSPKAHIRIQNTSTLMNSRVSSGRTARLILPAARRRDRGSRHQEDRRG